MNSHDNLFSSNCLKLQVIHQPKLHTKMFIILAIILTLIVLMCLRDTTFQALLLKFLHERQLFETAVEVAERDFPLESHFVTTSDGYILNIFRIYQTLPTRGHVVLLQHGMLSNSSEWVCVDRSIAFQLAEKGWDVWLGNNRGNFYSRDHVVLSPNSRAFNSYSFHEFAMYDLPATVDYIREKTNRQKIVYIGHSQGNVQGFVALAMLPEMNLKISAFFALAPVSSLAHSRHRNPFMYNVALFLGSPRVFLEKLGIHRLKGFMPRLIQPVFDLTAPVWLPFCNYALGNKILKRNSFFPQPNIVSHSFEYCFLLRLRNGVSWQELEHLSQSLSMKHYFSQLDYGTAKNLQIYGRPYPPPYKLHRIKTHVSLIWGQLDDFTTPTDLVRLAQSLRRKRILRIPNYKHLDFLCSTMHNDMLLDHIAEVADSLEPEEPNVSQNQEHLHIPSSPDE